MVRSIIGTMCLQSASPGKYIIVRSFKYDGKEYRRWPALIHKVDDSSIALDAVFENEIHHKSLGEIKAGTISREYYWFDRWYSIFRFTGPAGDPSCYYCNINVPPVLCNGVLSFVDMDIDIIVASDFSYEILDEDEFTNNIIKYRYPPEVQKSSLLALQQLLALVESRGFPFQ